MLGAGASVVVVKQRPLLSSLLILIALLLLLTSESARNGANAYHSIIQHNCDVLWSIRETSLNLNHVHSLNEHSEHWTRTCCVPKFMLRLSSKDDNDKKCLNKIMQLLLFRLSCSWNAKIQFTTSLKKKNNK